MFTRHSIPTPFQVGRVNAYVAGDAIVDPGPDSEEAWAALLDGLESGGMRPADVDRVLVTHPHPDHFGLAKRLRETGARVLASPATAGIVSDFAGRLADEQAFFTDFFERCGLSAATARTVTELPEAFLPYAPDVPVDRELEAGDALTVAGRTVTVDAVEGHAPGELLFAYDADPAGDGADADAGEAAPRHAVVGDNVLAHITPNPFLQPPPAPDADRPRVLPAYNRSLRRLRDVGYDRFLPGHGDPIDDPAGRIDEILAAHERRTDRVRELVDGPTTPADVMQGLFEDLPVTEQFSGLSEAVGHLDVLEDRGEVQQRLSGDVIVYEPTD